MIELNIVDRDGLERMSALPEDINLSLMEVLKALEYDVLATCGGMALCATCHVELTNASDELLPPAELELDMLDTLPDATSNSRLACQVRLSEALHQSSIVLR